jgi:non-ribosomal peptide synthetase component F
VPVAELPTDRPRPAVAGAGGAVAPFVLGPELTEEMAAFCSRRRVTLFMLLLAGFQALLERLSGEDDVAVGTAISNRNRPEIEGLIGPFSNNLVLRTDLSGAPDAHELVARTRAVAVAAYDAQDVPFEVLVERLDPVRDTGRHPLFQTMLTVQNTGVGAGAPPPFGDLELGFRTLDQGAAKFDLNLSLAPGERGISGSVEYRTDLYDASTIERTIGQLERLLEGMVR